jgi:hypothetical protein
MGNGEGKGRGEWERGKGKCRRRGKGRTHNCEKEKFLVIWGNVKLDEGGQSKTKNTRLDYFRIANFPPKKDGPQAIDEQGALGHGKANRQAWLRGEMTESKGQKLNSKTNVT